MLAAVFDSIEQLMCYIAGHPCGPVVSLVPIDQDTYIQAALAEGGAFFSETILPELRGPTSKSLILCVALAQKGVGGSAGNDDTTHHTFRVLSHSLLYGPQQRYDDMATHIVVRLMREAPPPSPFRVLVVVWPTREQADAAFALFRRSGDVGSPNYTVSAHPDLAAANAVSKPGPSEKVGGSPPPPDGGDKNIILVRLCCTIVAGAGLLPRTLWSGSIGLFNAAADPKIPDLFERLRDILEGEPEFVELMRQAPGITINVYYGKRAWLERDLDAGCIAGPQVLLLLRGGASPTPPLTPPTPRGTPSALGSMTLC